MPRILLSISPLVHILRFSISAPKVRPYNQWYCELPLMSRLTSRTSVTKCLYSTKLFSQIDNRDSKYALVAVFSAAISEAYQEDHQKHLNPHSHRRSLGQDYRVSGVYRQLSDSCCPAKSNWQALLLVQELIWHTIVYRDERHTRQTRNPFGQRFLFLFPDW